MTLELATVHPEPTPNGLVSAQDATSSWDCKIGGCPRPAHLNRGPYAYLCDGHRQEKVERDREERGQDAATGRVRRPQAARRPASRTDGQDAASGLVSAVKALEQPAQRLEEAAGRRRAARAEAREALDEFNAALRSVREAAEGILQDAASAGDSA